MFFGRESKTFAFVVCLLLGLLSVRGQGNSSAIKILFIGNSYTYGNDLPAILAQLMSDKGIKLSHESVTIGGATLEKHWLDGRAKETIHGQVWDYVVLQEQSTRPFSNPLLFFQYAQLFAEEIKKAGAKPIFFMTWAAKANPDEQPKLTDAYQNIGKETKALVAPVGEAWKLATLVGMELYVSDGRHPNWLGSYLAACVFYKILTGKSASELTRTLRKEGQSLTESEAESLQRFADETIIK